MAMTLIIVIINSRVLGSEGQGTAALIQLGILLIVSVTNFIAGGALVYLIPRMSARSLIVPAYLWCIFVSLVFFPILWYSKIVPREFALDVTILGLLQALFSFHLQIAMGKERIVRYNTILSIQTLLLASTLAALIFIADLRSIHSFVNALYLSFTLTYLASVISTSKHMKVASTITFRAALGEMWRLGKFAQMGNILQLLNYRANLYLLERLLVNGRGAAGIFSIGLYAGEAVWSVGKSLSVVQYARISNSTDADYNKQVTLSFFMISLLSCLVLTAIMVALPEAFYLWIFGDDMRGLHRVLLLISPGILANSGSVIISHHFAGTGRYARNTLSSGLGLAVLIAVGIPSILSIGLTGAAIAASAAYLAQLALLLYFFFVEDRPERADWRRAISTIGVNLRMLKSKL